MPRWQRSSIVFLALTALVASAPFANAQVLNRSVGGVLINADGVVSALTKIERAKLAQDIRATVANAPGELQEHSDLRMISLRGLQRTLDQLQTSGQAIPDDVRYMAGLQRVQYIFVIPERNDIVLAGPAEGWMVGPTGDVVGVNSGQPVVRLDDLIVALESHAGANRSNISCSIDPTAKGRQQLEKFLAAQTTFNRGVTSGIEKALGPQKITLEGVSSDSHLASVLVASDYRMKSLAMHLERSPIAGMPSFLDMVKKTNGGLNNMMPRWWMACDYDSIARSEDGLTWQLRGQGVKVMTEDEIVAADGSVTGSGKANPVAEKWSKTMTEKYAELSAREPIFGQLRNVMDLSVVAALLHSEGLLEKVGMDTNGLVQAGQALMTDKWGVPQTVSSKSSFIKKGRNYIITASGGVSIESWAAASKTEVVPSIAPQREAATSADGSVWRWN